MGAFSIFTDKKKRKSSSVPTVEEYYIKLARRATLSKFICIMLIASFVLYAFYNNKEELTIENFRYMLKFVDFRAETVEETASVVYYDSDPNNKGALLRGDLAVLNKSGLMIYDFNGSRLLKSDFKYNHPKMVSNTKNLIVCDIGGNNMQIFNSYSSVFSYTFSYPIYGLAASNSGNFLVMTPSKSYRSGFIVYDEFYRVIYYSYFGDKYMDCADISQDGKEVAAMLRYSNEGEIVSVLTKYSIENEENAIFSTELVGELALSVKYFADGSCAIITDKSLRFYSNNNELTGQIFFKEKTILGYEFSDNYAIITYNTLGLSSGTELDVYASDGTIKATRSYEGALLDKKVAADTLYVLTHGMLNTIDLSGKSQDKSENIDNDFKQLVLDGNSLILFAEGKAEYFKQSTGAVNPEATVISS